MAMTDDEVNMILSEKKASERRDIKEGKDYTETNPRATFYAVLYPDIRKIGLKHGYAIALHGSMARDMDLIACPWTEECSKPDVLIDEIAERVGVTMFKDDYPVKGEKPHGRMSYTLSIMGDWFIDISVMPKIEKEPEPVHPWSNPERNWEMDFSHENGNYQNKCVRCEQMFMGHKRRCVCKQCANNTKEVNKS